MIRVLLPDEMDDHHEARENLRSLYHGLPTSIHGQVCRNLLGSGRGGKSYFAPPDHDSPRYERVSYPRKVQYLLSVSYSVNSKLSFCTPVMVLLQPSVAGK